MAKKRAEIAQEDRWNVELLYPTRNDWEVDLKKWGREQQQVKWPEVLEFKGKISQGSSVLKKLFIVSLGIERALENLYTYAHLRHDEDVAAEEPKNCFGRIVAIFHNYQQETSWIIPEILELSDEDLDNYLRSDDLKEYRIYLEKIIRMKPHTLTAMEESLMAYAGMALQTPSKAFGSFNNADLKFSDIEDSQGNKKELTHGTYSLYLKDPDRTLRKNAFDALHQGFDQWENTLCELLQGQVQSHLFSMRARKYGSCLEAALFPHQIEPSVYTSLISAAREHLPKHHAYMALRKKLLGVDELHPYDLYVPVVSDVEFSYTYEEAEQLVMDSVAILGASYQNNLREGLSKARWVDRYENEGKRSGAYSSGCYDSQPYILMNFMGTFRDLTTLAHEAGHSMQTLLSNKNQLYHDSHYPIFVAEVASTFHEDLLIDHLLKITHDPKRKSYILNQRIDDIRATFFRQVMFAEFELQLHTWAEQGVPLTPAILKEYYLKLNQDYFGPDVVVDPILAIEWARIPHFYYNFYVYQYATGISAAMKLVTQVRSEGEPALKRYLEFLSAGGSRFPLELLERAGVAMGKPDAVEALVYRFSELVTELESML
jgi:oligoendopeptidase F